MFLFFTLANFIFQIQSFVLCWLCVDLSFFHWICFLNLLSLLCFIFAFSRNFAYISAHFILWFSISFFLLSFNPLHIHVFSVNSLVWKSHFEWFWYLHIRCTRFEDLLVLPLVYHSITKSTRFKETVITWSSRKTVRKYERNIRQVCCKGHLILPKLFFILFVILFNESPLKLIRNCFLFHLKSSFCSQDI